MGVAAVCQLRQLEDKNEKPKRIVADLSMDKSSLRDMLRSKPDAGPAPWAGLIRVRCLSGDNVPELGLVADRLTAATRCLAVQPQALGASASQ